MQRNMKSSYKLNPLKINVCWKLFSNVQISDNFEKFCLFRDS